MMKTCGRIHWFHRSAGCGLTGSQQRSSCSTRLRWSAGTEPLVLIMSSDSSETRPLGKVRTEKSECPRGFNQWFKSNHSFPSSMSTAGNSPPKRAARWTTVPRCLTATGAGDRPHYARRSLDSTAPNKVRAPPPEERSSPEAAETQRLTLNSCDDPSVRQEVPCLKGYWDKQLIYQHVITRNTDHIQMRCVWKLLVPNPTGNSLKADLTYHVG